MSMDNNEYVESPVEFSKKELLLIISIIILLYFEFKYMYMWCHWFTNCR